MVLIRNIYGYNDIMPENKERPTIETADLKVKNEVITDVGEVEARVPENVKTWMRKIEEDPVRAKNPSDDSNSQPRLQPMAPQQPIIKLPTTRKSFIAGFKKTVDEAGKWLSVFLLRLIKINDGKVKFKEEEET